MCSWQFSFEIERLATGMDYSVAFIDSHTAFYYQIGQKMPRDLELYGVMIKCGRVLFKNWLIPTELIEMQ